MNDLIDRMLHAQPGQDTWLLMAGAAICGGALVILVALVVKTRRGTFNAKLTLGFGAVQAGVSYIVITGTYEFFRRFFHVPWAEAGLFAVFIEACTWGGVGFIRAHGKGTDSKGQPNTGFGPAGAFFWVCVGGGGTLAVLGADSIVIGAGRVVIVALGAYMWMLRLLEWTTRPETRSRWRWTPRNLMIALGALAPADDDVRDEAREYTIRRLTKAMRWRNSRWPWSWLGGRTLVKHAEGAGEDVLAEARRRYAAAYVLADQVDPKSEVMAAVIASVKASAGHLDQLYAPGAVDDTVKQWQQDDLSSGERSRERSPDRSPDRSPERPQDERRPPKPPAAPVSPPVTGDDIPKWREQYAEHVQKVKDTWKDADGRDWRDADKPPPIAIIGEITGYGGVPIKQRIQKVLIADRAVNAGVA